MKEQVLNALSNSLVADSQLLKTSTTYLTKIRSQKGYCLSLMEIIDDHNNFSIKQAAMVQLKNTIKMKWNAKAQFIDPGDKEMIKNTIVTAIIRCGSDYRLIKLYRQVLKLIVSFQYKNWLPVEQIITKLRAGEDLEAILHCLIGIAASFQFSLSRDQRVYLFKMLIIVLPQLRNMLDKYQQTNLIYLSIKFLWKSVHYDIRQDVRQQTLNWMPLIMMLIGLQNEKFDLQNKISDHYDKNSNEFFYYHSKKWATRILLRFFQKHAKMKLIKGNVKDKEFATMWYQKYGTNCVQILYKQLNIPCIVKARYFQLKCFHILATENPHMLQKVGQQLQYKILPPYIQLKPQDQQLANSDPIEFLNKEIEPRLNYKNLKRVATDAWVTISEIFHKAETLKQSYTPGKYFYQNIKYLQDKLSNGNPLQKEMAMYLLCQLRVPIIKVAEIKQKVQQLIQKHILPQLRNEIMFLRARAVDIFYEYGTMKYSSEVIKQATQGVYLCLTQDQHVIVRIKAASAFNCILTHPSAKQLVKPHLKEILTIYLKLLETYDLQTLVSSLQSVIDDFATEIQPFAVELSKYMLNLFMRLFQKQNEENNEEIAFEVQLAASACIKTVARIIDAPLSRSTIQNLQKDVQAICYFVFSAENSQYIEDLLILLNSFIYKIDEISPGMWFFYQVIIYNLIGISSQTMAKIEACELSVAQKNVLKNIQEGNNTDLMEASMAILRNYLKKAAQLTIPNAQTLRTNMLQLLFYLIAAIYKKGPGQFTEETEMVCCTALLVSYIENTPKAPQPVMIHLYQVGKFNMIKLTSLSIKLINVQLLSLLFYSFKQPFVSFVAKQNTLEAIIDEIIKYNSKLSQQQNFKRVNLGLCSLLRIQNRPQILLDKYPAIFKTLFFNIRKVIESRIQDLQEQEQHTSIIKNDKEKKNKSKQETYEDEQDDQAISDEIQFDEDEDYWEEMFDQNYNSKLNQIDDVQFYEETLKYLQAKDQALYGKLLHIISTGFLINFEQKMQKAMSLFKQQQSKKLTQ